MLRYVLAAALGLGSVLAVARAAPARDAAEANRQATLMCSAWRSQPERRVPGITREPEVCTKPPEREDYATDWLLIASVLGVGGSLAVLMPAPRRIVRRPTRAARRP